MAKLHIYDVDGTILDSMRMWDRLSLDYLRSKGITPPEDLPEILDPMTLPESAAYMIERFALTVTVPQALAEIRSRIVDHYRFDLPLFEGAREELEAVQARGETMVILTNTPAAIVTPALVRTNVLSFFREVFTTELGLSKDDPEIFRFVCRKMGADPRDTVVHEDSDYAIRAAEKAGCAIVTYDRYRGRLR